MTEKDSNVIHTIFTDRTGKIKKQSAGYYEIMSKVYQTEIISFKELKKKAESKEKINFDN